MFDHYQKPARLRDSWLIRIGVALFLLGIAPFVISVFAGDNADVSAILAFLIVPPSLIIILVGVLFVSRERLKRQKATGQKNN